jgi:arylsulfatase A-like enzyme
MLSLVLCSLTLSNCTAQRRPNVLFLLTDDQRADTIRELGNNVINTPNLDRLVRNGVAFTRAVCANPICTPSRAEILSGCNGFRNGVVDFGRPIDSELLLWPQAMQRAGYQTWYVGKWHNDGHPTTRGYDETLGLFAGGGGRWAVDRVDWKGSEITGYRGWIFQSDDGTKYPEKGVGLTSGISRHFADAAIQFIRRKSEKPFFLHVNFTAPHDPLLMPPGYEDMYDPKKIPLPPNFLPKHPFDHGNLEGRDERLLPWPRTKKLVRETIAMYYAVISHLDEQIGRIIAALEETGEADNTIIIFSSDHGLGVGSHGVRGKQNMYEHTINVPLIIRGPGIPKNERRRAQVYLRELYPTVCDLAGIEIPSSVEGQSFAQALVSNRYTHHREVFGYFRDKQRMIRNDRWKLIQYPQIDKLQLFDLPSDPHELNDLANDRAHLSTVEDLRERLHSWQVRVNDPLKAP